MSAVRNAVIMPVLLVCIIVSSCADKIKTSIIAYRALDGSLVVSNSMIDKQTQHFLVELENKRMDPATAEKASIWHPKAQLIRKLCSEIYGYLEVLKSDLKKEAGLKINDGGESFKETDKNAVIRLFEKKGKGEEVYERLKTYEKNMLTVDPELSKEFTDSILLTTPEFDAAMEKSDFTKTFFDDIPTIAALAMLSKFQNNVVVVENNTVNYCNNKVWSHIRDYDIYAAFAVTNSSYVEAREEIEITAGVGAFSRSAKPEIIVAGQNIPIDADGAAHYKFKVSNKPGKYKVPVQISFFDQDGKKQTVVKSIEYTVAEGKQ